MTTVQLFGLWLVGLWLTHTRTEHLLDDGHDDDSRHRNRGRHFYVSELVTLPAGLGHSDAFIEAGINRMPPIAITTFAAILALLPLALGLGAGSAMPQPLATAIISKLVLQMPLVLILLPVLLSLVSARRT